MNRLITFNPMRGLFILFFVSLGFSSMSQVQVGFGFGTYAMTDRYELSYIDKQVNYGAQLGLNFAVPVFNKKLMLESGLFLYDFKYKIRGEKLEIPCGYGCYSYLRNSKDINVFGINVPVNIVWNSGKISPFVGIELSRNLSPNKELAVDQVSIRTTIDDTSTLYDAESIIIFSGSNVSVNGGVDYVISPRILLRFQYSRGLNDFKNHRISTLLVDGVNINGTTVQSNRVDRFQLSAIYIPDWDKNKVKRQKKKAERSSFKERIKMLYL